MIINAKVIVNVIDLEIPNELYNLAKSGNDDALEDVCWLIHDEIKELVEGNYVEIDDFSEKKKFPFEQIKGQWFT